MVTTYLGARHPARLIGIHLNMVVAFRDDSLPRSDDDLSEQERAELADARRFVKDETGYQRIQGTKPQTLACALNDSPAGLAAWIVESSGRGAIAAATSSAASPRTSCSPT
jgi:epoxide hydrolase